MDQQRDEWKRTKMTHLKGPFGSRRGTSTASRASKRHGPFHHEHTLLSILVFIFVPSSPDIGRNRTSAYLK